MDPSSHGVCTHAQSQFPPPPPLLEGTAHTPFISTPPHRTNKPWTKVVTKGATTPLTAAQTSLKPDHPFNTTNPFTPLCSTHDDLMDDGSGQSDDVLLTPADGDDTAAREFAVQPDDAAAPRNTRLTLAMIMANAVGLAQLRELVNDNAAMVTKNGATVAELTCTVTTLTTELTDIKETAECSYHLASSMTILITSQEARLLDIAKDVSRLTSDIDDLHVSTPALVQSVIEPVKASMDLSLALAIETAETAIKSSFDTSVTTLNDKVAESMKAFEHNINALHGSSYGHLTKTTLPEFARRIDALEARNWLDKVDPSDNENVGAGGDTVADDNDDAVSQPRSADDAGTRRRSDAAADVDDGLDACSQWPRPCPNGHYDTCRSTSSVLQCSCGFWQRGASHPGYQSIPSTTLSLPVNDPRDISWSTVHFTVDD